MTTTMDPKDRALKKARAVRVEDTYKRRDNAKFKADVLARVTKLLACGADALDCPAGVFIVRPGVALDAMSQGGSVVLLAAPAAIVDEAGLRERGLRPSTPEHRVGVYFDDVMSDPELRDDLAKMSPEERKRTVAMLYHDGSGLDLYDAATMREELDEVRPALAVQGVTDNDAILEQMIEDDIEIAGFFGKIKGAIKKVAQKGQEAAKAVYKGGKGAATDVWKGVVKPAAGFGADMMLAQQEVLKAAAGNPELMKLLPMAFGMPPMPGGMPGLPGMPGAPAPGPAAPQMPWPMMPQQQPQPQQMPWWMQAPPWYAGAPQYAPGQRLY